MAAVHGVQLVVALCLAAAIANLEIAHTSTRAIGGALGLGLGLLCFCVPPYLAAPSALRSAWLISATSLTLNACHWSLVRHMLPPATRSCLVRLERLPRIASVADPILRQLILPAAAGAMRHRGTHRGRRRSSTSYMGRRTSTSQQSRVSASYSQNASHRSASPPVAVFTWRDFEQPEHVNESDGGRSNYSTPQLRPSTISIDEGANDFALGAGGQLNRRRSLRASLGGGGGGSASASPVDEDGSSGEDAGEEESMVLGESALSKGERERILAAQRDEKRREAREKMKQMRAMQHKEQLQLFGPEAVAAAGKKAAAEAHVGAGLERGDAPAGKAKPGLAAVAAAAVAAATAAEGGAGSDGGKSSDGPVGRVNSGCLRRARASSAKSEHGGPDDPGSRSESTSRQRRNARRRSTTDGMLEMPGERRRGDGTPRPLPCHAPSTPPRRDPCPSSVHLDVLPPRRSPSSHDSLPSTIAAPIAASPSRFSMLTLSLSAALPSQAHRTPPAALPATTT